MRLLMLDRFVNLVDEGVDVALRIGNLTDSSHISTRIGGDVRRVVVASPAYLAENAEITEPADLARHDIVAFSNFGLESWSFPPAKGVSGQKSVHFAPRYIVNSVRAAAASTMAGIRTSVRGN